MKKLPFEINVPISVFKEGKTYVAYSPVLDLSTCGKTYAEVQERFAEAVELFFEELVRLGTLGEVLSDLGWKKTRQEWQSPAFVSHKVERMKVVM